VGTGVSGASRRFEVGEGLHAQPHHAEKGSHEISLANGLSSWKDRGSSSKRGGLERNGREEIGISSREIHESEEEIRISLAHLHISSGEICISLKEIGISLADLPISSRKTPSPPVDFWVKRSAAGNGPGV